MGPLYNFGMLTAGAPDFSRRQASTPVMGSAVAPSQSGAPAWQQAYDALVGQTPNLNSVSMNDAFSGPVDAGWMADPLSDAYTGPNSAQFAQIRAQRAVYMAGNPQGQSQGAIDPNYAANQKVQQSAYDQSNGGGFNGGIINASYGTPFGMSGGIGSPTQVDGVNMPETQPWGMAGYGGPTGAVSQGGFGTGLMAQGANQAQPSGWGGPFTNKNPWAAS